MFCRTPSMIKGIMGAALETFILSFINYVPLEVFVLVASFLEEVVAPVPSASVLLVTGAFAAVEGRSPLALVPLVLLAALGKTVGSIGVYYAARALGHTMIVRYGRWFGVTEKRVRAFGERFTQSTRSFWLLTLLRALPIVPSALVSIGGGALRIHFPLFLAATLVGTIVRDTFFIYVGFAGVDFWQKWAAHSTSIESYVQLGLLAALVMVGVRFYWKAKKKHAMTIEE